MHGQVAPDSPRRIGDTPSGIPGAVRCQYKGFGCFFGQPITVAFTASLIQERNHFNVVDAREILVHYEEDSDFRDHVNRYIHDFEAMLRQLLSTRDGHALGVTLLSSDMGKLYVALAQSIERLRN